MGAYLHTKARNDEKPIMKNAVVVNLEFSRSLVGAWALPKKYIYMYTYKVYISHAMNVHDGMMG